MLHSHVYRFLISIKTLLLLASIWLVSAALLFVAGWLLGRHQSAPTVDSKQLAAVLDATAPVRASAASSEPNSATTKRRSSTPWQKVSSGAPAQTAGTPGAGSGVSAASPSPASTSAPPPPPSASAPPAGATVQTGTSASPPSDAASSAPQGGSAPGSSSAPPPPPSPPPAGASGSTTPAQATSGSPEADAQGGFSLQIGAYASEQNAQAQVEKASDDGLAPFIVPVVDAGRTLYTVRIGHYGSREEALEAADRLRSSKDLPAVIRAADPG